MKHKTAGDLQALELLMQTTPGFEHFDSGADGMNDTEQQPDEEGKSSDKTAYD